MPPRATSPNILLPSPSVFGLPEHLRWDYDQTKELGTVVVDQTLAVSSLRHLRHLGPSVINSGEENTGWSGVGVTIPSGWETGLHPIRNDANYGGQTGVDTLHGQENRTVLVRGAVGALALGLATWFKVGPNARVVALRSNPDFDPTQAQELAETTPGKGRHLHPYDPEGRTLMEQARYDAQLSLHSLIARLTGGQPHERLYVGTAVVDGGERVRSLSHDLVLGQSPGPA